MKTKAYIDREHSELITIGYHPEMAREQVKKLGLRAWGWVGDSRAIPEALEEVELDVSPITSSVMKNTTTTDEAWETGDEWVKQTYKYDKLEYLKKNCTAEFLRDILLPEMMQYLFEYQFNEIFNRLRENHGIKTP